MSHSAQRKEKNCLNCGAIVKGHYCQECGQENIEPKETFWHMVTHFFYDITHFDSSFFVTIKDLLIKPGFLTKEYIRGRRKMYLHPIRMYVFTSAVFFLVFYSLFQVNDEAFKSSEKNTLPADLTNIEQQALGKAKTKEDSMKVREVIDMLVTENKADTSVAGPQAKKGGFNFSLVKSVQQYKSVTEYDSIQKILPEKDRDNWFVKMISRRAITINVKYKGDQSKIGLAVINKFIHSFPYLLFVSLPLYALFLKILYYRRRQFYYADHGVFLIHTYIFTFLLLLLYFSVDELESATQWGWLDAINFLLLLTGIVYVLKAMKFFYEQGWGKTILKFIIFNILCLAAVAVLFTGFLLLSFYQV